MIGNKLTVGQGWTQEQATWQGERMIRPSRGVRRVVGGVAPTLLGSLLLVSSAWADDLTEYAEACNQLTGTEIPDFVCSEGVLVPTTNLMLPGATTPVSNPGPQHYQSTADILWEAYGGRLPTQVDVMMDAESGYIGDPNRGSGGQPPSAQDLIPTCDYPNRLNGECDPGTYFHVLHRNEREGTYIFALCRPKGNQAGGFNDIGIIQTNLTNGATCFFSSTLSQSGAPGDVKAPIRGLDRNTGGWGHWMTPTQVAAQDCHGCHDNGPIIRSPFLTQLPDGRHSLSFPAAKNFNIQGTPYRFVGADFATWSTHEVDVGQGGCASCHRMGANNGSDSDYRHGGASLNYSMWSTTYLIQPPGFPVSLITMDYELARNPSMGAWMPPASAPVTFPPHMWDTALAYRDCAESWRSGGAIPMPSWCHVNQYSWSNSDCDPRTPGSCMACSGGPASNCFDMPAPSDNYADMLDGMFGAGDPTPQEYRDGFANFASGFSYEELYEDLVQPRAAAQRAGIVVDGVLDATAWAASPIKTLVSTVEGVPVSSTDSSAGWRITWDSRNLYFFANVVDDVRLTDNGPSEFHKDDSVELYIDGRDRRNPTYGSGQEFQVLFRCAEGAPIPGSPGRLPATIATALGANSAPLQLGQLTAACIDHEDDAGYDIEASIPWAALNVPSGNRMAVEVHVNDDDETGDAGRETQQAWHATTATAWQDPRQMTAVELADEIQKTTQPVVVGSFNGNAVWSAATAHSIDNKPLGADSSVDTATWKATFDHQKLYVLVSVNDNIPRSPNSSAAHNDDSVEIYLDADHTKNWASYGPLDAQVVVRNSAGCGGVEFGANGLQNGTGFSRCVSQRANGYDVELSIPWSAVGGFPGTGARIGFDVHVNDDDTPGSDRDYKRSWFAKDDQSWTEPATFGSVRLMGVANTVTAIAQLPSGGFVLDGVNTAGEWDSYTQRGIDNLVTGTAGSGAKWRAAWAQDYLYVFVTVPDASIKTGSAQWWNDDSIELFFDGDRSRSTSMDHINDRQMVFRVWDTDTAQAGPNSQPFSNVVVRWANLVGTAGYSAEILIPWREVSVFGEVGSGFGFDVQVNDDDTGGNRGGKRAWKATSDNTWQNASLMASVGLTVP